MTAEQKKAAPVLSVNHVVKAFGAKRAVDDVTLDVMPGDIFGFVGHNGAGKTTLIRAIVTSSRCPPTCVNAASGRTRTG